MNTLKEALTMERSLTFVGRNHELDYLHNWLRKEEARTEVICISGMGGIGKSTLMLHFKDNAQKLDTQCLWLDGRTCPASPTGIVSAMVNNLFPYSSKAEVSQLSERDLVASISRSKTILCIDHYDALRFCESWLRENFLPKLPANGVLILLATRQDIISDWQKGLAWRNRVKSMHLEPISPLDAMGYFRMRLYNKGEIDRFVNKTKGLPLAMALSVEGILMSGKAADATTWQVSTRVSAELLQEVATPELQDICNVLCILPEANVELLNRLLNVSLSRKTLDELLKLSFIHPTMRGFALHEVARPYLLEDFLLREPERYATLRYQIIKKLCRDLQLASIESKHRVASDLLLVCRETSQLGPNSYSSSSPYTIDSYRQSDLPHLKLLLLEMIEREQLSLPIESSKQAHDFLEALADRFPECFFILRSADGLPLAFSTALLLYKETMTFLETFMPEMLKFGIPSENEYLRTIPLAKADTYYQFLGTVGDSVHLDSFDDSINLSAYLLVRHATTHSRTLVFTKLPKLGGQLKMLGFTSQKVNDLPIEHPSYGALLHQLNLRQSDFSEYALTILGGYPANESSGAMLEITDNDIITVLSIFTHAESLAQSKLASKLKCSGIDLQQRLKALIFDNQPRYPLNARKQSLLKLLCEKPELSAQWAADCLHLSRATYYRCRSEAIHDLKRLLSI